MDDTVFATACGNDPMGLVGSNYMAVIDEAVEDAPTPANAAVSQVVWCSVVWWSVVECGGVWSVCVLCPVWSVSCMYCVLWRGVVWCGMVRGVWCGEWWRGMHLMCVCACVPMPLSLVALA